MNKQEFIDDVTEWHELIDFCNENKLEYIVDDIISEEMIDDFIKDRLENSGWQGVACCLDKVNYMNDDFYKINGYGNLEDLGDIDDYKNEVLSNFDSWDEEEEDIEDDEEEEE